MKWNFLAVVGLASLGGCNPAAIEAGLQVGSAVLPYITTDLQAALTSSQVLVAQAAATPAIAGNPAVLKKAAAVNGWIAQAQTKLAVGSPNVATTLQGLNTATAGLLGTAGALGVNLPGVAR